MAKVKNIILDSFTLVFRDALTLLESHTNITDDLETYAFEYYMNEELFLQSVNEAAYNLWDYIEGNEYIER